MKKPTNTIIIEKVKQMHYSSPDYKPEPGMTHNYNVCPMCGIITKLESTEQVGKVDTDINVISDSSSCNTCNNVRHLHPHIHEWINLLFVNLDFQEDIREQSRKIKPVLIQQEAPLDFIDAEIISEKDN